MNPLTKLGRYTVLRRLAGGGMGDVYLAKQEGLAGFEKVVVLKTLRPDLAQQKHYREMFFEEARIAALARHTNVVSVLDIGVHSGIHYIVMEYIEGWSLRQVLGLGEPGKPALPFTHNLTIAIDVACALHHIHSLRDSAGRPIKLVHRDVSPENVMLTVDGQSKIVDFGIAKRQDSPIETAPGTVKGKLRYLAPEQVRGFAVTPAADQYAFACVIFEMCAGQPLVRGALSPQIMYSLGSGKIPDPGEVAPHLPSDLVALLRKALSVDPQDRFASCGEVADELARIQEAHGLSANRAELIDYIRGRVNGQDAEDPEGSGRDRGDREPDSLMTERIDSRHLNTPVSVLGGRMISESTVVETQVSSLIGRDAELDKIAAAFAAGAPVVTLLGPGGIGKTSLARYHGHAQRFEAVSRESYFCDLTEARSASEIAYMVASAIELQLTSDVAGDEAIQHIGRALAGRGPCLLILDNVEQVIDAAAKLVSAWLRLAPDVRVLATSREPLNIRGEHRIDVEPLGRDQAVDLLYSRIKTVRPKWTPDEGDFELAGIIVDQLDRLPLAIELAAARGAVLSIKQLCDRLTSGLDWLRSRRRDASSRHASLSDAIAWSWELLSDWEREALSQCSVFRGGFSLIAAEQVVVLSERAEGDIIDAVQSLREKSLLYTESGKREEEELRFRMYESIRSFATTRLSPDVEAAVRARHLQYYVAEAERLAAGVETPEGPRCFDRLAENLDNLNDALAAALDTAPELAARLVLAVDPLLAARGPARLHSEWLEAGLRAARSVSRKDLEARILRARGLASVLRGDSASASADLERAIAIGEELSQPAIIAEACEALAFKHLRRRDLEGARACYKRAHTLYRQLGDGNGEARIIGAMALYHQRAGDQERAGRYFDAAIKQLRVRGNMWAAGRLFGRRGLYRLETGRISDARRDLQRSIHMAKQWGDVTREATDYLNLGYLEMEAGRTEASRRWIERALLLDMRRGNRPSQAIAHINLGVLDMNSGNYAAAEEHLREGLAIAREVEYVHWEVMAIGNQGILAQLRGDLSQARELLEACQAMQEQKSQPLGTGNLTYLAHLGSVQAAMGNLEAARATFARCREELAHSASANQAAVVECLEGFCDLAEAAELPPKGMEAGMDAGMDALRARARARLSRDASESCDLRIAQRVLAQALGMRIEGDEPTG